MSKTKPLSLDSLKPNRMTFVASVDSLSSPAEPALKQAVVRAFKQLNLAANQPEAALLMASTSHEEWSKLRIVSLFQTQAKEKVSPLDIQKIEASNNWIFTSTNAWDCFFRLCQKEKAGAGSWLTTAFSNEGLTLAAVGPETHSHIEKTLEKLSTKPALFPLADELGLKACLTKLESQRNNTRQNEALQFAVFGTEGGISERVCNETDSALKKNQMGGCHFVSVYDLAEVEEGSNMLEFALAEQQDLVLVCASGLLVRHCQEIIERLKKSNSIKANVTYLPVGKSAETEVNNGRLCRLTLQNVTE